MGPYGSILASCHPASADHLMVAMWSVNTWPNPGATSICARCPADAGDALARMWNSGCWLGVGRMAGILRFLKVTCDAGRALPES